MESLISLHPMISITPKDLSTKQMHAYLLGAIAPRPIAFASTVDKEGNVNLSPFSFFNVFSANPPIVVFSPARRGRDNTTKHTYENILEVPEVVINIVNYDMVQQASLASTEYAKGVNEFEKAGFTELASNVVKPPRVAEAPVQMECKVKDVIVLGEQGGAGNLVICEVVKYHAQEYIFDEHGVIDPYKIDTVSRLGVNWYSRAKSGLFEVPKPLQTLGMGIDQLPHYIRNSNVLTGNDLGKLGNVERFPNPEKIHNFIQSSDKAITLTNAKDEEGLHRLAKELLANDEVESAWMLLMHAEVIVKEDK